MRPTCRTQGPSLQKKLVPCAGVTEPARLGRVGPAVGYLLLVLQSSSAVVEVTDRRVAAAGSSVLMHAPDIRNVSLTEWEFKRNDSFEFILQYFADSHAATVYPPYQGRVLFYPKNGSILLQRVQETDSGVYKATINLMQDKARKTLLEVINPVPQPELQYNSNLAGLLIELTCVVPEGTVDSISWMKDRRPLPPEMCYLLPGDTAGVLQIRSAEKSDCGSYSCNVSNKVSWKEAALNLMVTGLTPPLRHVQKVTVAALIFVATTAFIFAFGTGCAIALCERGEHRVGSEAWKHITLCTHVLLGISSLLLLAVTITWMQEQGPSAGFALLGLFFFAATVGTAGMAAVALWRPAALSSFQFKTWHHIIRNSTAPTTLIVDLLFNIILLHKLEQLDARGCSERVDVTVSSVLAALAVLVVLLLLFFRYRSMKQERTTEKQHTSRRVQVMSSLQMTEESQGGRQEQE